MRMRCSLKLFGTSKTLKWFFGCALEPPSTNQCCRVLCRVLRLPSHYKAGDHDIGNGERQQKLPAEIHELVIPETWQRAANPDVQKDKKENLKTEPSDRQKILHNLRSKVWQ